MAGITDYTTLKAELSAATGSWTGRADLTAKLDVAVQMAESRIRRDLVRLATGEIFSVALATVLNQEYLDLPADFLSLRALFVQANSRLEELDFLTPSSLYARYPSTASRQPRAYTIVGKDGGTSDVMRVIFRPIPDGVYTLTADYFKDISSLPGGATVNWFLTKNPDAYLYASLRELAVFRKQVDDAQGFDTLYKAAMGDIEDADKKRKSGGRLKIQMSARLRSGN